MFRFNVPGSSSLTRMGRGSDSRHEPRGDLCTRNPEPGTQNTEVENPEVNMEHERGTWN